MRRLSFLTLLGFVALQASAYANTVWGTVSSVSGDTLQVSVANSDEKELPSSLSVTVKDTSSLSDIQANDQVKLNVKTKDDGSYEAQSVQKVDSIPQGQAAGSSGGTPTT
jgi:hypothetical protein